MTSISSDQDDLHWYAIWTWSRHEQAVRRELTRRRVEAFVPTVIRWSKWRDRRKKLDWPLFPGYCFARFSLADKLAVLNCAGIARIVSFAGEPMAVPDVEVNNLRLLVDSKLSCDPCPFLREGALVEVADGPFRGVIGRLVRKDSRRATLMLSVDVISQAVRIEVNASDVVPR